MRGGAQRYPSLGRTPGTGSLGQSVKRAKGRHRSALAVINGALVRAAAFLTQCSAHAQSKARVVRKKPPSQRQNSAELCSRDRTELFELRRRRRTSSTFTRQMVL